MHPNQITKESKTLHLKTILKRTQTTLTPCVKNILLAIPDLKQNPCLATRGTHE